MDKRRLMEWGKNALILLLAVSALYLLTMTPLVQDSGLADLFSGKNESKEQEHTVSLSAAAQPSCMAVTGANGRYGLQYDQAGVDTLFAAYAPLLGEGLSSARTAEPITEAQWQACLARPGVYFDFDSTIPLSALSGWLSSEGVCALEGSARRLLLAAGVDDPVLLCYEDGESGQFYACVTGLSRSLHLEPLVNNQEGNDAQFAFEHEKLSQLLRPYTLIAEEPGGDVYAADNPLTEETAVEAVLGALSFSEENHALISGGDAYLDGDARLEITDDGALLYQGGEDAKYPVAAAGDRATAAELIEAARQLAEATVGSHCGEARLYLESLQETEDGWLIRFGYRLNGSAVRLYDQGWAAQFHIREDVIREFTLYFRSYTATGETALLLPMERAAVILPGDGLQELAIQYRDGGAEAAPLWVAK